MNTKSILLKLTIVGLIYLAALFLLSGNAYAATINLDTDFNGVGYLNHNGAAGGNGFDSAVSVVIDSNGKYVVTGASVNASGNQDMAIWRYNPDGTLDTSFNGVGYVSHNGAAGGNAADTGWSLRIDNNGKYVVAGYSVNASNNQDMAIWRYNPDGTLDTTFNGVGYVSHNSAAGGNSVDNGYSLDIDSNGKYVVAGSSTNIANNADMTIWRYNPDGTLDTTFNSVGYVTHNSAAGGNSGDAGMSVAIDKDGRYVVAGLSKNSSGNHDMALWRYNLDGTLDTTFNGVGYTSNNGAAGGNSIDWGAGITIDHFGKYLVSGYSTNSAGNWDITVWRYNSNGSLDTSFNGTGIFSHGFSSNGNLNDASMGTSNPGYIDENNKFVFVGYLKKDYSNTDFLLIRLNSDGALDTTLNGVGYVYIPKGSGDDIPYSLATDSHGKYVVAGNSTNANLDMAMWVVLDYPHTISLEETPLYFATNAIDIYGNVAAPKSTTKIGAVSWSLTITGNWTSCTALDGGFDSLSENFKCEINGVTNGKHRIYVRSCDEFGSCTYRHDITSTNEFVIDTSIPSVKITNLGLIDNIPDKTPLFYYFTSQTPTIKGKTEANATVHFKYDSNDYTSVADSSGNYTINIPELPRQYVTLSYYAVDQAGNKSETRKLNLMIGEENFPKEIGEREQTGTVIITPAPTTTGTPTPAAEPSQTPQSYELVVVDQKGNPLPTASVFINEQKYTANVDGKVYVKKLPSSTEAKIYVEIKGVKYEGNLNGSKVIVEIQEEKSKSGGCWWWVVLLLIIGVSGYWYIERRKG